MKRIKVLGGLAVLAVGVGVALAQAPANMSFFVTSANPGQGRQPRRPGRRGRALPIAGAGRRRGRQDLARVSLDEHRRRQGPHRQRTVAERQGRGHRTERRGSAQREQQAHGRNGAHREGHGADVSHGRRGRSGATSRGSARARHPDGHERGRHEERRHVQQLDGRRGRDRDARPCGPPRPQSRRELVERDPRVAGLLDGEADADGRHRLVLLLRDELIADTRTSNAPSASRAWRVFFAIPFLRAVLRGPARLVETSPALIAAYSAYCCSTSPPCCSRSCAASSRGALRSSRRWPKRKSLTTTRAGSRTTSTSTGTSSSERTYSW